MSSRDRTKNLRPVLTSEEAKKRGSMGGKRCAEAKRERKRLRELLEIALAQPCDTKGTHAEAITSALVARALTGDVRAYEVIRDTLGEKPTEQVAQDTRLEIVWGE